MHHPTILPYCHLDGIPTLKDSELAALYARQEGDGGEYSRLAGGGGQFVREVKDRSRLLYVVLVDGQAGGMLSLTHFQARFAFAHLVVFREFWGRKFWPLGRQAVHSVLQGRDQSGGPVWDGFVGLIPQKNRPALAYARYCGFKETGVLPFGYIDTQNNSAPAVMLALGREGMEYER